MKQNTIDNFSDICTKYKDGLVLNNLKETITKSWSAVCGVIRLASPLLDLI